MSANITYQDGLSSMDVVYCHDYARIGNGLISLRNQDGEEFLLIPVHRIFEIRP